MSISPDRLSSQTKFISNFESGGRPPRHPDSKYLYSLTIIELNKKILKGEYLSIIQDKELFWQAFCVSYIHAKGETNHNFVSVGVAGESEVCIEIQDCVEEIRRIFARHWEKGANFYVIPVYKMGYYHFISSLPEHRLNLSRKTSSYSHTYFNDYVRSALHKLCVLLNCSSSERSVSFKVKLLPGMPSKFDKYHAIEICLGSRKELFQRLE